MGIFLSILAKILFWMIFPLSVVVLVPVRVFGKKSTNRYFYDIALSIDQLGNVVFQDLFLITLITSDKFPFGNTDHTISYVLSKNQQKGTLSKIGMIVVQIIEWFDPGHMNKAINSNEN